MTLNFPGPLELRLFYTVYGLIHEQRLNMQPGTNPEPGDLFSEVYVYKKDLTTEALDVAVDAYVALLKPLLNSANSTINYAELWEYPPESNDASFISVYDISEAGSSGSSYVIAGQQIATFRTANGGSMRWTLMEGTATPGNPLTYSGLSGATLAMVDYLISDDDIFWGRDNSFPFAFNRLFPGQNEALFKKRYRPT